MNINNRLKAFKNLGIYFKNIEENNNSEFKALIKQTSSHNHWFTETNIKFAIKELSKSLEVNSLEKWVSKYPKINENNEAKKIGIIAAGNIPLVGFHDILSVLISGHKVIVKLSSKDDKLLKYVISKLIEIEPEFTDYIEFTSEQIGKIDAIIATGSDNTSKYFEYYFGKYPNIIRKNRNSVAVLTGNETEDELKLLADDIFVYFGLGCRNVSKIFIPENYDIDKFFKAIYSYNDILNHDKYNNNYTYNKTVLLMNKVKFWENGFFIFTENPKMSSPISVIYFEKYKDISNVNSRLLFDKEKIQCIVSNSDKIQDKIDFGETQKPKLWDYADNVDTLEFLLSL